MENGENGNPTIYREPIGERTFLPYRSDPFVLPDLVRVARYR
jgi:hypothetical protein